MTINRNGRGARGRNRAHLLFPLSSAVAAVVVLSVTSVVVSDTASSPPTGPSGVRIELVNHLGLEFLPLKPRGEGTDAETAEDAWAHIPGGPGNGRLSESTIKSECRAANGGTYATSKQGSFTYSTCDYSDINGDRYRDYFVDGRYYSTRPLPKGPK